MRLSSKSNMSLPLIWLLAPPILMAKASILLVAKLDPLIPRPSHVKAAQSKLQLNVYRMDIRVLQPQVFLTRPLTRLYGPQLHATSEPTLPGQAKGTPLSKPVLLVTRPVNVLLLQPFGSTAPIIVPVKGLTLVTRCGWFLPSIRTMGPLAPVRVPIRLSRPRERKRPARPFGAL